MHFPREMSTKNTAEYEGLLAGLRIAADLGVKKLIVRGDSQLVVRQVNKDYQSPLMEAYVDEVRKLEEHFDGIQAERVPRAENDIADYLFKACCIQATCGAGYLFAPFNSAIRRTINRAEQAEEIRSRQVPSRRAPWDGRQGCCRAH